MVANRRAPSALPTNVIAVEAASAASFHPLNAQIRAGARKPSGRYSHCSGCIRFTVHHGWMSSTQTVSMLRPGEEISGVVACTRKDRLTTRAGSSYLALELRDRTGAIPARAFRDADALAAPFERGDLVEVTGRVERFRDDVVVEVVEIARAAGESGEADPARF